MAKRIRRAVKDPHQLPQLIFFQINSDNGCSSRATIQKIRNVIKDTIGVAAFSIVTVSDGNCALPFFGRIAQNARTALHASKLVVNSSIQGYKIVAYTTLFAESNDAQVITTALKRLNTKGVRNGD